MTALRLARVKGLRLIDVEDVDLTSSGPAADRAFHLIDADGRWVQTVRTPELLRIVCHWDVTSRELELVFPDGSRVAASAILGSAVVTQISTQPRKGRVVEGPLGPALSASLGRPVELVKLDSTEYGAHDSPVSLMSRGSLRPLEASSARRSMPGASA